MQGAGSFGNRRPGQTHPPALPRDFLSASTDNNFRRIGQFEEHPRDSLLQIEADELFEIATGILGLGERRRVRLFVRRDPLDRFVDCLVCIPRERFNTDNRERVASLLRETFGGVSVDWSVHLSDSLLARVHYIVHCDELPRGRTQP